MKLSPAIVLASLAVHLALPTTSYAQAPWKNVHISAGSGFVTDIVAQPKVPGLFYMRTDVGGFYRWDAATQGWIPITDFIPVQQRKNYGGESIAVDPNDANTVYIACGGVLWESWDNEDPGMIYKSTDRGATWTAIGPKGVIMSGNSEWRWGGERLAVQPSNSNVILFGSRHQGLWRTDDGGTTWQQTDLPFHTRADDLISAVAFDPNTPSTVYAAVAPDGIFKSMDSGRTWTNISAEIHRSERLTVAQDSTMWLTYHNGVAKYVGGAWINVTPKGATANAYCGLAVNPRDPNNVIVSYGLWGDTAPTGMFMTSDAGATWTRLKETAASDVPWYVKLRPGKQPGTITDFLYTPISNFVFDPNNPRSVWFSSAGGIFSTADIDRKGGPLFQHEENGHEELCFTCLAAPPSGAELIAGVMDVDGFVFDKGLDTYPTSTFINEGSQSGAGATGAMTYEETKPRNMVRLCSTEGIWRTPTMLMKSTDGGFVWTLDKSFPQWAPSGSKNPLLPLSVAESATDPDNIVAVVIDSGDHTNHWYYSKHGMRAWETCAGLPVAPASARETGPVAADPIAGGTFYAYVAGIIYRSTDGGANFRQMSAGTVGVSGTAQFYKLVAQPGLTGDLWLSEDNDSPSYLSSTRPAWEGLYHSSDAGKTWTKLPGISRALNFCFGKASPSGHNTLYYYGRQEGDTTDKIFRSTDLGSTWVNIQHPGQTIGDGPWEMEGSRQTYGRVFIGTYGRGIYYSTAESNSQ